MTTRVPAASMFLILVTASATAAVAAPQPRPSVSSAAVEAHARFLADDLLEGRGVGTRGSRLATAYIAAVFRAAGLQPVRGSAFQRPFDLRAFGRDAAASLSFPGAAGLRYRDDFVVTNLGLPGGRWSGRPLFVGYAIDAPEEGWDDYKDVDVTGRLLVAFTNEPGRDDPAVFAGPALTAHGRWTTKLDAAARRGAAGMLLIHTPSDAGYPWDVIRNGANQEVFALADDPDTLPLRGWVTEATASRLAAAAGTTLDRLRRRAETRGFVPEELPVEVGVAASRSVRTVEAVNVVGVLPGAGPGTVVLTAHHDHLGIGPAVGGDRIYNGAVDNGSALAVLLALAQAWAATPPTSHPTLVFAAVDAEEVGLLGSREYTRRPAVPLEQTLANVNFEMTNVWGRTRDIVAIGAEHSELADLIAAVCADDGLVVAPDPAPEQGFFFRSDQYSFAKAGVPSLWIDGGTDVVGRPPGWGAAARRRYRESVYHRPGDEVGADWDTAGLVQIGDVTIDLVDAIAAHGAVAWRPGSAFSRPTPTAP